MKKIGFCLVLVLFSSYAFAEFPFSRDGITKKNLSLEEMKKISTPRVVSVYEPHEYRMVSYEVVPLKKLLDSLYGSNWINAKNISFECEDGYKATIPTKKFVERDSYLAFARKGSKKFSLVNKRQANEDVFLGPLYLVWQQDEKSFPKNHTAHDYPYQVTAINLLEKVNAYEGLEPGEKESAEVKKGFSDYKTYCWNCHTMNGRGGEKGVELNFPQNVTEYLPQDYLRKWILDPTQFRYNSRMPKLGSETEKPEVMVDSILTYLKWMASHKQQPN